MFKKINKTIVFSSIALVVVFYFIFSNAPFFRENQTVKLTVIGEDWAPLQAVEAISAEFEAENGIEVDFLKFDLVTLRNKVLSDFSSKAGRYDVVMGPNWELGLYAENNWVVDIDDYLETHPSIKDPNVDFADIPQSVMNITSRYQGKLYALPMTTQGMFLWYRKDLFESKDEQNAFLSRYGYDLPKLTPEKSMTWAQYRDVTEFFTRKSGEMAAGKTLETDLFGTVLQAKNHVAMWFELSNFFKSFGANVFDPETGQVAINSPEAVEALSYYIDLQKAAPPGTVNYTWDEAVAAFFNGQVAVALMWSDSLSAAIDNNENKVANQTAFSAIPTLKVEDTPVSFSGSWGLFVSNNSKHIDASVKFLQWINRPEIQVKLSALGLLPATAKAYGQAPYGSQAGTLAQRAALDHAFVWSNKPYATRISDLSQNDLSEAIVGKISPEEALSRVATKLEQLVSDDD